MMQFYLMNLAILRDLKIDRLNMLNVPEMNFLTFWGLSGVELDAKVNVPTGVKKFSLPVGRPTIHTFETEEAMANLNCTRCAFRICQ